MAEYTIKDVIIDPEDPRIELGAAYYFGGNLTELLTAAREDDRSVLYSLDKVNPDSVLPFQHGYVPTAKRTSCLIRKKEVKKALVPFYFRDEDDRERLRYMWLKVKDTAHTDYQEGVVAGFLPGAGDKLMACINGYAYSAEELFENWCFLRGEPCGKVVETDEIQL